MRSPQFLSMMFPHTRRCSYVVVIACVHVAVVVIVTVAITVAVAVVVGARTHVWEKCRWLLIRFNLGAAVHLICLQKSFGRCR